MKELPDYYEILGVSCKASQEEIKRAYRQLAFKYHPDRNPGNPEAEEQFKKITEAYAILIDPEKRTNYDRMRNSKSYFYDYYSQEEIFRSFFKSQEAMNFFKDLQQELAKMGFRFDESFLEGLFFGGRRIVFKSVFFYSGDGKDEKWEDYYFYDKKSFISETLGLMGRIGKSIVKLAIKKALGK